METSILSRIKEGEHQQQDFKYRIDDQKKIARTLVAFANTDGGRLLIGVKDNGKITGINPEEEFHMIQGAATMFCKPSLEFESKVWQEGFRLILEIRVPKSESLKYMAQDEESKWKIYIRRDDHTLLANKILIKIWNLEKKGIPKPQHFGNDEQLFLNSFPKEKKVSLSQLYKWNPLPKNHIDHLLSLFVYWKVIQMELTEEGTFYFV